MAPFHVAAQNFKEFLPSTLKSRHGNIYDTANLEHRNGTVMPATSQFAATTMAHFRAGKT